MVQNNAALVLELLNTILLSFGGNFFDFSCGNNLRIDGMRFSPSWANWSFVLYDEPEVWDMGEVFVILDENSKTISFVRTFVLLWLTSPSLVR